MKILSIGEVLWDVFDRDHEFVGGAPLNFAAHVRRLGHAVALLSAVGEDPRGDATLKSIRTLGLETSLIQRIPGQATGIAVVQTDGTGNPVFAIARPAAFDFLHLDPETNDRIRDFSPDWIYFGTLAQTVSSTKRIVDEIIESFPNAKRFYDINLRDGHWNLDLVERLSHLANTVKMNQTEAEILSQAMRGNRPFHLDEFCQYWSSAYNVETICVTLGSRGCALFDSGRFSTANGFSVKVVDTVGAGDAFSAGLLHGLVMQWPLDQSATFANALGALVASRLGATPDWTLSECQNMIRSFSANPEGCVQSDHHLDADCSGERP
jgi:fructokinase